jgi:hypothetical protein
MLFGGTRCVFACIALIGKGDLDRLTSLFLRTLGKFRDLGAVLFIGDRHAQGEQMPKRIGRQMELTAFPTFGSVITSAPPTLERRLQGPAIKDCGSRAFFTPFGDPQSNLCRKHGALKACRAAASAHLHSDSCDKAKSHLCLSPAAADNCATAEDSVFMD